MVAHFKTWNVFYDPVAPAPQMIVAAVALAAFFTVSLALLEGRSSEGSRRTTDAGANPLAPRFIVRDAYGPFAGEVTVTVLIPAHDEETSLPLTLSSLRAQSYRPDRVIVVADNCEDATVDIALEHNVTVVESVGNSLKKAGALNQVLAEILPSQSNNDLIMVMDADTTIDESFLQEAVSRFARDRTLMAIGGRFFGEHGCGLLGQLQRNEYVRYSREIARRRGRVFVLTGTASIFRAGALRAVAEHRSVSIPGRLGDVYDTAALTEDNELTLALKSLGAPMTSPAKCSVVTEVMPTPRSLWNQRLRWQRGALENIGAYGLTRATQRYWAQQLGIGYSVIALTSFLMLMTLSALAVERWVWLPFWLGLGSIFVAERVATVWKGGWGARLLAAFLLPELLYDMFLNIVYVWGIVDITLGRQASWDHVTRDLPKPKNLNA